MPAANTGKLNKKRRMFILSFTVKKKLNGKISSPLWSIASNFASRGLTFVFTPIFTRILSPSEFGIYSLYVSLMGIFTVVTTFEISGSVMYRGLAKFAGERKAKYLSGALGAIVTLNILFLTLYIIFRDRLNDITSLNTRLTVFLFLQVFLNAAMGIHFAERRYSGAYRSVALLNVGMGTLSPILALTFIYLGGGGESRIIAPLVSTAFFAIPVIYRIIKKGKSLFSKETWGFLFRIAPPMLPHYLSLSLIAQVDRIIIARSLGEGAVGRYSAAYSVGFLLSLVTSGLLLVLSPITMRWQNENKTEALGAVLSASGKLIGYATLTFLTLVPEIFYLAVSGEYYEALPVVYPVALSAVFLFLSNAASNSLLHYEKPAFIMGNSVFTAVLCVALSLLFIRFFGYVGGAYATLISYFTLYVLNNTTLKKISKNTLNLNYSYRFWLLLTVYSIAAYILRFSFFARILLLSALMLMLLPELKKYKKLLFA